MSSEIVKNQLKKVNWADLSNFDPITNTYIIKKYSKPQYHIGKMYLVKVSMSIINNKTSVLAINWNHNTAPTCEYLKIYVSKIMGKNIFVDSIGFDNNTKQDLAISWSGYLPVDDLTQIATL